MINCVKINLKQITEAIIISLILHFEADFLWKVSLKILNSGLILKSLTPAKKSISGVERSKPLEALGMFIRKGDPYLALAPGALMHAGHLQGMVAIV